MTTKELRQWIGKEIEWETIPDPQRGYYDIRRGSLREGRDHGILTIMCP